LERDPGSTGPEFNQTLSRDSVVAVFIPCNSAFHDSLNIKRYPELKFLGVLDFSLARLLRQAIIIFLFIPSAIHSGRLLSRPVSLWLSILQDLDAAQICAINVERYVNWTAFLTPTGSIPIFSRSVMDEFLLLHISIMSGLLFPMAAKPSNLLPYR
jgi:hypothetical protein